MTGVRYKPLLTEEQMKKQTLYRQIVHILGKGVVPSYVSVEEWNTILQILLEKPK